MENPPENPAGRPHLFVREGGRIVDAPPADQAVAAGYAQAADKGHAAGGYRLTLLAEGPACTVGQTVRIIHVCESVAADAPVYPMGPKPVTGEYVDGQLVAPQGPADDHPLIPPSYDGRVAPGPGLDFNFDITEYTFGTPGRHSVQWRPGSWESNTLWFDVT
ncbi:hypothetical protein [Arthrobacter dokdonensis]|uniref:hypothetical protein n=1 Tax=Arthrobacter dokdonellae TaxID=2211210 RepID=UPI000DE5A7AD|nr:hypothetical protein [Arthrobacter dokdonellae]